ncbi:hypothetical protein HDU96_000589 [Phlyctochytrium bullatum]|nr:hypothetical protein HDU96_000589 [Phlyctochytrium bullatum]
MPPPRLLSLLSQPRPLPLSNPIRHLTTTTARPTTGPRPIDSIDVPPPTAKRPPHLQRAKPAGPRTPPPPSKKPPPPPQLGTRGWTIQEVAQKFQSLPPRTRLYLSLGLMAFSLAGMYITSKLEEWFPVPAAPEPVPTGKAPVRPRSRLDEILMREVPDDDDDEPVATVATAT